MYITNLRGNIKLPHEPGLLEWLHKNYPYSKYRLVDGPEVTLYLLKMSSKT